MKFRTLVIAGAMLAATSCSTEDLLGEFQDADVSGTDETPAEIILMPDGFGNLAAKCHGPNMVYSSKVSGSGFGADTGSGSARALTVVADDPRCQP